MCFRVCQYIFRKWLNAGTVPSNKEYAAGTVPANKKYTAGKVPINMEYAASTLKNLKFQKVSPYSSKYVLVRPQKCQNYVQRSIVTVIPEGIKVINLPLLKKTYFFVY